jgi:hypothetical protein
MYLPLKSSAHAGAASTTALPIRTEATAKPLTPFMFLPLLTRPYHPHWRCPAVSQWLGGDRNDYGKFSGAEFAARGVGANRMIRPLVAIAPAATAITGATVNLVMVAPMIAPESIVRTTP